MSAGRKAFALFAVLALVTLATWVVVGRPNHRDCHVATLGYGSTDKAEAQRIHAGMPAKDRVLLASCDGAPG
jgi:hypothetical protein